MHAVVALALPAVEVFDLAIPAQVFAGPGLPRRYEFTVCAPAAGLVRSTAGFSVHDGGQAQWLERPVPAPGEGLAATCQWALEHLADRLTIADLARHAGWAPRTLARRFAAETGMAPMHWLTAARVREAGCCWKPPT